MSFVKGQQKAGSKALIDRFVKKAELPDAGALQASTTEDGKLRTWNPADRSSSAVMAMMQPASPLHSCSGGMAPRSSSYQAPVSPMGHSHWETVSSPGNNLQFGQANRRSFAAELPADTPNNPVYQLYRPVAETGRSTELPDSASELQPRYPAELPAGTKSRNSQGQNMAY
ncbi:hypothetical protein BDW75DRAFT_243015 [Aspergillus navahoensis]